MISGKLFNAPEDPDLTPSQWEQLNEQKLREHEQRIHQYTARNKVRCNGNRVMELGGGSVKKLKRKKLPRD